MDKKQMGFEIFFAFSLAGLIYLEYILIRLFCAIFLLIVTLEWLNYETKSKIICVPFYRAWRSK